MKRTKRAVAVLVSALLLCALLLSGCTGEKTEIKDFDKNLNKACLDWLKNYVTTEKENYNCDESLTEIKETKNTDGNLYEATGILCIVEKETKQPETAEFKIVLENVDYVGMSTATFRLMDFQIGEFTASEAEPPSN